MKKNMISIAILALLVVNVVLTAIMMVSVISANKKTAALVGDIAAAVEIDLGGVGMASTAVVPMESTITHTIADQTILLEKSVTVNDEGVEVPSSKSNYAMLSVTLSMNMEHEDYPKYGADMASREDLIKGIISEVVRKYTLEEASTNSAAIEDEILNKVQELFGSEFIFDVTLPKLLFQ